MANNNHKLNSGELEVSGYFETGWWGEGEEEVPEKKNLRWLIVVVVAVFVVLLGRVTYLQIIKRSYYQAQAEENRIRKISIAAPRGIIYDRNHQILASNLPEFDFVMIPGLVPKDVNERQGLFREVSAQTQLNPAELEDNYKKYQLNSFSPVPLKEDLSRDEALRIEKNSADWSGLMLSTRVKRSYPEHEVAAHLLGYTGKISEQELKQNPDYELSDIFGKEGVEVTYEKQLQGVKGNEQLEVDSTGKVKKIVGNVEPKKGNSLVLSLDLDMQREAYNTLAQAVADNGGVGGAVVALDPRSGSVLALANYPSFDNAEFTGKISPERFREIMNGENRPLFDRAVAGTYPPGSTFKPLVAAAALDKKIISPSDILECPAVLQVGQWHFADWKFHGPTDLDKAISQSVNTYFYIIGGGWGDRKGLGPDNIKYYANQFGLGQKLGIDIPQEAEGLIPDPAWKKKVKKEAWYIGDTYHTSIGQGDILLTPLQLASYVSALVNGGTLYRPHFLDYVENSDGTPTDKPVPEVIRKNLLPEGELNSVKQAMGMTVSSEQGSGRQLQDLENKYGVMIGGKTGTAETGEEEKYHAWFVGFAPLDNPEVVVAALVEKGGEGYKAALPVAKRVLDVYLGKRANQ
jgi:penicillin-binding protein 2